MIDAQLRARNITNPRVLDAIARVPRHAFVPNRDWLSAYEDRPLPIGHGQTISQPYIVGYMTQMLEIEPEHVLLEIGTGSGYQTAVLAHLAGEVYTVEIVPELAEGAERRFEDLGLTTVHVRAGNGYHGWPEHAPFPRIIVTAAPPDVPAALVDQLAVGGLMVIPVGTAFQEIAVVRKTQSGVTQKHTLPVRFVPMVEG